MPDRYRLASSAAVLLLTLGACHPQSQDASDTTLFVEPAQSDGAWGGRIGNSQGGTHSYGFQALAAALSVAGGNSSCSNTTGQPFCTIQAAINAAPDGSTISVAAGVYTETLDVSGRNGLSIVGAGRDSVTLRPTTTLPWNIEGYDATRRTPVRVVGSTGISFSGISFDFAAVAANFSYGVLYWDSSGTLENNSFSHMSVPDSTGGYREYGVYARAPGYTDSSRALLTVRNNLFVDTGRVGVLAHDYVDALIQGNTFRKDSRDFGYAIELGSQATGAIRGNNISGYDLAAAADESPAAGIFIENAFTQNRPASLKPVLVEGNDLHHNQYGAIIGNDYPGLSGNVDIRVTLKNNDVHDNTHGGVYITDSGRSNGSSVTVLAQGNRIRRNGAFGYAFITDGNGEIHASLADEIIEAQTEATRLEDGAGTTSESLYDITIQSATSTSPWQTVTFDVIAREPRSGAMTFSWSANTGSLGVPQTTTTTSNIVWTAPVCAQAGVIPSVTAVVTNASGLTSSRSFSISGLPTCGQLLASGYAHSLTVRADGTVWAWGYNHYGQVGDGTTTRRVAPVQVTDLNGVTALAAGHGHTVALRQDGTVWSWGWNNAGQLGNGTTTNSSFPVQVTGLSGVTALAASGSHTVALRQDGTVWSWGGNSNGQLGDGTTVSRTFPVQVTGLSGVTALAAGHNRTVALRQDGTVWVWGIGFHDTEDGTVAEHTSLVPVQVPGLSGVTAIAAGGGHTVALRQEGTVWAWGRNYYGQLGNGTDMDSAAPVQVLGLSGVTAIAAGSGHTVALRQGGAVWTWGNNSYGQLGDGTTGDRRTLPASVPGLIDVTAIAAGDNYSVALRQDGTLWAWGYNGRGQLGDGSVTTRLKPVQVLLGIIGVTALSTGINYTVALRYLGTVWGWGYNQYGQLGWGTGTYKLRPVQISNLNSVTALAAGGNHTVTRREDGTVWAQGNNGYGQLGDGSTTQRLTPVRVTGLSGVTALAAGANHTVALRQDGTVWTWGWNSYGQLGDGSTTQRLTPVQVPGLSGVTALAAGYYHTVALRQDGTVWTWGWNNYGQLGDGTTTQRLTPVQVPGLSGITALAAGSSSNHTVVRRQDGTVWTWGSNNYGQLGDGTTTQRLTPVQVPGLSGVTALAAGGGHTVALRQDGTVWNWGWNTDGQLGDGTTTSRFVPAQVPGLSGVIAIAAGGSHTVAACQDSSVWGWGKNFYGQVGDGSETPRHFFPVLVLPTF
jgi:alpha-tubulin suppressor-like RCC1 family protein